ncbi:MAG: STAS domain-containing protein [SAR324 cluster bacterium]|nr:STAS domain-containing protein [SAR324 cluster bacterium]
MELSHSVEKHVCIVLIEGELIQSKVEHVKEYVISALIDEQSKGLILDLKRVVYVDTAGVAMILVLFRHLKEQEKKMAICQLPKNLNDPFEVIRFNNLITIYNTQEQALASF